MIYSTQYKNCCSPDFKGILSNDTKDKLLFSTPLMAAVSSAYKVRKEPVSNMILQGTKSGLRWGGYLLALGTILGINKIIARHSDKFRSFEQKHGMTAITGVGIGAVALYYGLEACASNVTASHPNMSLKMKNAAMRMDSINIINQSKSWMRTAGQNYQNYLAKQPEFLKNCFQKTGKLTGTILKYLPFVGVGMSCALSVIKPKLLPNFD